MPTENRSSTIEQNDHAEVILEMVSVPREQLQAWQERFSKAQMFKQSTEVQAALAQPAPQPHPEPIAWMVGTAFWWTKEEAERDAAATGLPIVGLGPLTVSASAEQYQGEPVAWRGINDLGEVVTEWIDGAPPESMVDLCGNPASFAKIDRAYAHDDPVEVERLREDLAKYIARANDFASKMQGAQGEASSLREQLRVQDALLEEAYRHDIGTTLKRKIRAQHASLSASAEPSAMAARIKAAACPGCASNPCICAELGAQTEVDERAAPEPSAWRVCICGEWQYFSSYERALKERQDFESDFTEEDLEESRADGLSEPEPMYAGNR